MGLRLLVRTLSELCLTAGALIVLFVVYVLYWTGVRADDAMEREIGRLQQQWAADRTAGAPAGRTPGGAPPADADPQAPAAPTPGAGPGPGAAPPAPGSGAQHRAAPAQGGTGGTGPRPGAPFAVMTIPRLGAGWAKPVLEGTGTDLLKRGLGHYAGTAGPGGAGNFAVAGHRRTYGDPFKDLPALRPGDAVVLTVGAARYTYRVDTRPYRTLPTDTAVIDPVPAAAGYREPGRYLTLTTCDPEWGHSHRLVVWGHLESTEGLSPSAQAEPKALHG
ncbi:class E sortase [Streptomyces sp. NPDC049555]|uniref:class E sortase n=1 Tax=Streptomyces sp. NPDC049555 TaxID=3154930 RepID=UPI0034167245